MKRSVREVADRCLGLLRDRDNFSSQDRQNESRCFLWVKNFDLLSRALLPAGSHWGRTDVGTPEHLSSPWLRERSRHQHQGDTPGAV